MSLSFLSTCRAAESRPKCPLRRPIGHPTLAASGVPTLSCASRILRPPVSLGGAGGRRKRWAVGQKRRRRFCEQPLDPGETVRPIARKRAPRRRHTTQRTDDVGYPVGTAACDLRDSDHGGIFVDQKHEELFAHERFELREGKSPAVLGPDLPEDRKSTFVRRAIRHGDVEHRPDRRLAEPALGHSRLQLCDLALDHGTMHRLLGVLLPWRLVGGALSNEGLDERQAVDAEEYLLLEAIASVPPGIETLNDPARDIRLPGKED